MIKKKEYKTTVRVTFELPAEVADSEVAVVGDFNDWDPEDGKMEYVKTRDVWKKGVSFDHGETHEFRYLIDGTDWRNDEAADEYVSNSYLSENSVVKV